MATPESNPDSAIMILADHGELWIFGTESVEVWRNTGDVDAPFQPARGATMQKGLQFRYSVVAIGDSIFWVSRDSDGGGVVVEAQGYRPREVSNYAVTHSIQEKEVTGAAPVAWAHQSKGHYFYVLTFPDDNLTWAYDTKTDRVGGWHERMFLSTEDDPSAWVTGIDYVEGDKVGTGGSNYISNADHTSADGNVAAGAPDQANAANWDDYTLVTVEESHRGRCCEFIGGEDGAAKDNLVGDRASGKIYALSMDTYDDDGDAIRRIRRCQHLSNEMVQIVYDRLELDVAKRDGLAIYNLRWSNNGGEDFGNAIVETVAETSDINPEWRMLGIGRDRVFEVSSDSAVKHAWLDAYIDARSGMH